MADEPLSFDAGQHAPAPPPPPPLGSIDPASLRPDPESVREPPAPAAAAPMDTSQLGSSLAAAMIEGDYHPVVLFGTAFSGKTSLLLSLFATIMADPRLGCSLVLCDALLGARSTTGQRIHDQARHTFEVKTQAFLERQKIPKTAVELPFFIPVELRPSGGKPAARFAFLESNGESYRPERGSLQTPGGGAFLFQKLQAELEEFIATYERPITFIYLAPYTQLEVYADVDVAADNEQLKSASQAIQGALTSYDRIRTNARDGDFHLMLVTKWDAYAVRTQDRRLGVRADRDAVDRFAHQRYPQPLSLLQGLGSPTMRGLDAYCAGIIDERGLRPRSSNDETVDEVQSYAIRLWRLLYRNALGDPLNRAWSPFPEPPPKPLIVRAFNRVLDFVGGQ